MLTENINWHPVLQTDYNDFIITPSKAKRISNNRQTEPILSLNRPETFSLESNAYSDEKTTISEEEVIHFDITRNSGNTIYIRNNKNTGNKKDKNDNSNSNNTQSNQNNQELPKK